ncbi:MAG TPA: phosphodiesterase [Microbacterium sp.]|uniref:phosphodiesterase n=1 Tax=Microbacterium sp. TaxID=51671 RepID=UPI002C27589E|nr:phosphodiesterase [Microbacterium sp.]HWI32353.1 phosphodiesterase [Microbacterium sp.]
MTPRQAEHPRPERVLLHISDTHLRDAGGKLYDRVDSESYLRRTIEGIEASGVRPQALVFTGDLADRGEAAAYEALRDLIEPLAARLAARVFWVMGNHDDRPAFRRALLDEPAPRDPFDPIDRVDEIDGLRLITLDTSVPGHHHGEVSDAQLAWLERELAVPAPYGTILAMHHPPVPCVLDLAATVELREQSRLAAVLRGTDVRAILAGHLHYSTFATFAGIPVSVASATCYTQDLTVPQGGTRGRDGAQAYNLVHVYDETIVHSVVPVDVSEPLDFVDADETRRRLDEAGVTIPPSLSSVLPSEPPTTPISVLH